jgi:hypothetical protein
MGGSDSEESWVKALDPLQRAALNEEPISFDAAPKPSGTAARCVLNQAFFFFFFFFFLYSQARNVPLFAPAEATGFRTPRVSNSDPVINAIHLPPLS